MSIRMFTFNVSRVACAKSFRQAGTVSAVPAPFHLTLQLMSSSRVRSTILVMYASFPYSAASCRLLGCGGLLGPPSKLPLKTANFATVTGKVKLAHHVCRAAPCGRSRQNASNMRTLLQIPFYAPLTRHAFRIPGQLQL